MYSEFIDEYIIGNNNPVLASEYRNITETKRVIKHNNADKKIFDVAVKEFKKVQRNIKILSGVDDIDNVTPIDLFNMFLPRNIIASMLKWIVDYGKGGEDVTIEELYEFILVDLVLTYYKTSPTHLFKDSERENYPLLPQFIDQSVYKKLSLH